MTNTMQLMRAEVDELFRGVYRALRKTPLWDAERRFELNGLLLEGLGSVESGLRPLGVKPNVLRAELESWPRAGRPDKEEQKGRAADVATALKTLQDIGQILQEQLKGASVTYVVASYQSPLRGRRQSLVLWRPPSHGDRLRAMGFIAAFFQANFYFASTDLADEDRSAAWERWYTPTQAILEGKVRVPWSPPLLFNDSCAEGEVWSLPLSARQSLLSAVGIDELVTRTIIGDKSEREVEDQICALCRNTGEMDLLASGSIVQGLRTSLKSSNWAIATGSALARDTAIALSNWWGLSGSGCVDGRLASFMMLTHAIWKEGCPDTVVAYTFPVLSPDYASALTIGVEKPLNNAQMEFVSCLAGALFTQPLTIDYAQRLLEERLVLLRKSARAAIMSRNLSHNIGSHSLASARFAEAVGVLHLADADHLDTVRQDEMELSDLERACELSNPKLCVTYGEIWRAQRRLNTMNSYLQGRMDFIAKALGETSSLAEPMFFINGLLRGFLNQGVLLNTLLSDSNYIAKNLRFVIKLPEHSAPIVFEPKERKFIRHVHFEPPSSADILVAVPGGMIGRHAFYAFLENILRNAAKYGHRSADGFLEVTLSLRMATGLRRRGQSDADARHYILTVTDNISDGCGGVVNKIRTYLNQDIINKQEQAVTRGHGVQEMKLTADFLAGGEASGLCFMIDNRHSTDTGDYQEYVKSAEVLIDANNALRCYAIPNEGVIKKALAYDMIVMRPTLIGVVCANESDIISPAARTDPNFVFDSIESLGASSAYFGVIASSIADNTLITNILDAVERLQHALPYRLLVACESNEVLDSWRSKLTEREHGKTIASRRVHCILAQWLFDKNNRCPQNLVRQMYESWLGAWKNDELSMAGGVWNLFVGFDRPASDVEAAWLVSGRLNFESRIIKIHLFARDGNKTVRVGTHSESPFTARDLANPRSISETLRNSMLVFDNHGKCVGGNHVEGLFAAYHRMGSGQLAVFQALFSPPAEEFARSFLIYSVVESMLLRVGVVDERVSAAMVAQPSHDGTGHRLNDDLFSLLGARIVPVFSLHINGELYHLGIEVRKAVESASFIDQGESLATGGLYLGERNEVVFPGLSDSDPEMGIMSQQFTKKSSAATRFDVIVIHEGVAETCPSWPVERSKELEAKLLDIAPRLVRTSGRGGTARKLSEDLPFLEFSELSENTYRQLNKIDIGRELLFLRGVPRCRSTE